MAQPVSAPGKLMLAGEYAVLEGAPALVMAVDARAVAYLSRRGADGSPSPDDGSPRTSRLPLEAVVARQCAERATQRMNGDLGLDLHALRRSGKKLGLGSSAAGAVAAAGLVYSEAGADLAAPATRRAILEAALAGHKQVAPGGSGADVVAATYGGLRQVRVEDGFPRSKPVAWSESISIRIVWTGEEARTSDHLERMRDFRSAKPLIYNGFMASLSEASSRMTEAVDACNGLALSEAASVHGEVMGALGEAAGVSILTPRLRAIDGLARAHGGGAKPSGAGGGDVAVAFFAKPAEAEAFEAACRDAGLELVSVAFDPDGVRGDVSEGREPS